MHALCQLFHSYTLSRSDSCHIQVWKFGIVVVRSSSMHLYQLCPTFVRWNALTGKAHSSSSLCTIDDITQKLKH